MEPSSAGKYEDILQEGLDRLLSGQESLDAMLAEHPDRADDLRADLQMASLLTNARPEFDPRPGFVGASKARLLRQIAQETHAPRASPSSGLASRFSQWVAFLSRSPRLAYSLVALAVFACSVFLFSGVTLAKAARLAIPGDLIYPVKTAAEDVQLAITPGLAKRAELYIRFAGVRLVELQILAMENRFEYIEPTMRRYENQSRMALDALARLERTDPKTARAIAQEYKRTLEEHTVILAVLAESMPTAFRTMLLDAVALLQATSINVAQIISTATAIIQSTATATDDAAGSVLATITNDLYLFLTRTPTSTLSFSATPTGTVTPTLTATVYNTPTATVTATITSTPQPSPTPTWLPTPTETQKPTKTPKPTKVPKPTKTPKDKD